MKNYLDEANRCSLSVSNVPRLRTEGKAIPRNFARTNWWIFAEQIGQFRPIFWTDLFGLFVEEKGRGRSICNVDQADRVFSPYLGPFPKLKKKKRNTPQFSDRLKHSCKVTESRDQRFSVVLLHGSYNDFSSFPCLRVCLSTTWLVQHHETAVVTCLPLSFSASSRRH